MDRPFLILGGYLCLFFLAFAGTAWADTGKELFRTHCAGCHTIGGGKGVGPDLKGVSGERSDDWLVRIIVEPDRLTAEKDPAQLELVQQFGMEMPKLGIDREDARKIVAYLKEEASPAGAPPAAPAEAAPLLVTPQLLATGRALFTGRTPFAKGGPPCASCHGLSYPGVRGGALAGDLTGLFGTMQETGLRGALGSLGFPVMRKVYADRPLTEPETQALLALFKDASAHRARDRDLLPAVGLGFFILLVAAAVFRYRRIR